MLVSSSIFSTSFDFTTARCQKKEEILILVLFNNLLKNKELKLYVNPKNTLGIDFYFKYFPNVFEDYPSPLQFRLCLVSAAIIEKLIVKANEQIPNLFWGRKYTVINRLTGDILGETEDNLESQQKPLYPIRYELKYIFAKQINFSTAQ